MFYLLISLYSILAIIYRKSGLVLLLLLLQIVSLASVLMIQLDDYSEDANTLFNVIYTFIITLTIILPYKNYTNISSIKRIPTKKFNSLSKFLFVIGGFCFVVLLVTALIVNLMISDINAFKYQEGASTEFYYKFLPFDVRFYILAYSLYYFSYFNIPLHFYCQYIGDKKKALLYFFFSLNIILYGFTYFSRWTIVLFVLLYLAHWICYSKLIPTKNRKKELKWFTLVGGALAAFFLVITFSRFGDNSNEAYERAEMNDKSIVKNTSVYSLFDYLGKSNSRSLYYLKDYKGQTFEGRYMFSEAQNFFSVLRIVSPSKIEDYLDKVWTEYQGTFRTYACYLIFDVGYIMALVISIILIYMSRLRGKAISFDKYIISSLFMMVPICSIFFSYLNVFLLCLIFYGFIKLYLKLIR